MPGSGLILGRAYAFLLPGRENYHARFPITLDPDRGRLRRRLHHLYSEVVPVTCSDLAWHELWTDFNRLTTERIRIRRAALAEVVECHGAMPNELIAVAPRQGSATVEVNRKVLFAFLNEHGEKRCDAK